MENKPQKIREIEELLSITLRELETHELIMGRGSRNNYFLNAHYDIIGLNLHSNQIQDISFLEGLNNLQSLGLSDNQIQDTSFLQGLNNLQESQGKLENAIQAMKRNVADIHTLMGVSSKFHQLKKEQLQGTISYENYQLGFAKITQALLQLLEELA